MAPDEPQHEGPVLAPGEETTGDAALDERLKRPVLKGDTGTDTAQVWMGAFLVVVAGMLAYSNIFTAPFQGEDLRAITGNTRLHALTSFPEAAGEGRLGLLTLLSLALNWRLAPGSPAGFRCVNLILHLANAVLLLLAARRLYPKGVSSVVLMTAGMLFVLHPLATETLNYAVGRAELLSALFGLAAMLVFLKAAPAADSAPADAAAALDGSAARAAEAGTWPVWGLSVAVLFYILACGAAAPALALPLILLGIDGARTGFRRLPARLWAHGPFWAALVALLAVRWAAGEALADIHAPFQALWYIARRTVVPVGLNVAAGSAMSSAPVAIGVACFAGVLAAAVFGIVRGSMGGAALWWFAWAALLGGLGAAAPAERQGYFALAGGVLLVPWVLCVLPGPRSRTIAGLLVAALTLAAGTASYMRNLVWQDPVALWSDSVAKTPGAPGPLRELGRALINSARFHDAPELYQQAEVRLREASDLDPGDLEAANLLGIALADQDRADDALGLFTDVVRRDPCHHEALVRAAGILFAKTTVSGDLDDLLKALDYYRKADAVEPLAGDSLAKYGVTLWRAGDLPAAEGVLTRAGAAEGDSPLAPILRSTQETLKQLHAIEQQAAVLLQTAPASAAGLTLQAQAMALRGRFIDASYLLDGLGDDPPPDLPTWMLAGLIRAKMNAPDHFLQHWPRPPVAPAGAKPWQDLARTCAGAGQWDAALQYLESPDAQAEVQHAPLLVVGRLALQMQQGQRAREYLERAAGAAPADPEPWLLLADAALAEQDTGRARQCLAEAETRGAAPDALAERQKRLGIPVTAEPGAAPPGEGERTVIIR